MANPNGEVIFRWPLKFWEKKNKIDFSNIDWAGLQNNFLRNENDTLKNENLQLTRSITHQSKLLDEILLKLSKDNPFEIERIIFENNGKLGYAFHADSVDFIAAKINIIPIFKTPGDPLSSYKIYYKWKIAKNQLLEFNEAISPVGFTYYEEDEINFTSREILTSGWGSDGTGVAYSPGIYTFQLFFRDKMIGAEKFRIYD